MRLGNSVSAGENGQENRWRLQYMIQDSYQNRRRDAPLDVNHSTFPHAQSNSNWYHMNDTLMPLFLRAAVIWLIIIIVFITIYDFPLNFFFSGFLIVLFNTVTSRGSIIENENRRIILAMIEKRKGITFTALKNELGLQNGVLAYHLATLEKNRYIKSFIDGRYKRFYPRHYQLSGLTSTEEKILSIIHTHPFITNQKIAKLIHHSPGTVYKNIRKLIKKGLVGFRKDGKCKRYHGKEILK